MSNKWRNIQKRGKLTCDGADTVVNPGDENCFPSRESQSLVHDDLIVTDDI
jgi:hypothetical protein